MLADEEESPTWQQQYMQNVVHEQPGDLTQSIGVLVVCVGAGKGQSLDAGVVRRNGEHMQAVLRHAKGTKTAAS